MMSDSEKFECNLDGLIVLELVALRSAKRKVAEQRINSRSVVLFTAVDQLPE